MFTGIITDIGTVAAVERRGDLRVRIRTAYDPGGIALGASIACSGACLTVVATGSDTEGNWFEVDISSETVSKTATGRWTEGRRLNLERALKVGDELGGHIVAGHVDAVGEIVAIRDEGDSRRFTFRAPPEIAPFLAPKGSVAIDGVSLTVNEVEDTGNGTLFGVNVIPHTAEWTTLGGAKLDDEINLEVDTVARYLRRMETYHNRV
jgi:riboflavin synthase